MKAPEELINPPKEYSVMPFWFWNDRLNEHEILHQIADFAHHGVYGFVIHPRVGLPRELGWMSEQLLSFYEIALKEARRCGMKVLLYDEGMYPSGSSCGQVVAANPDFQCRCLAAVEHADDRPYHLHAGENLIAIVRNRKGRQLSIIDRKADSVIRGLHYINDGPEEDTPPAADILNPDAVDCFIDLVYQKFVKRFSFYFGETILGIFTDEPDMLGRCREKNVFPCTANILGKISTILGYDFTPYLAELWSDDPAEAKIYREIYYSACSLLLEKNYYSRLRDFCIANKIQLTGHPARADDLGILRYFDIPGQDLVWRWVLPDNPTALEGEQSTQAKCSSSAMIHAGKRRNLNECCGAYGHELTWEEMIWLAHWCIIRGVNMLIPHAFYYSIRGCRKDERPPCVGPHAPWWPKYREYADAFRRLCWINIDSKHVCSVAILGKAHALPWKAARICFENQIDFNYIEERYLWEDTCVSTQGIQLAGMNYQVLLIECDENPQAKEAIQTLEAAGRVIRYRHSSDEKRLAALIKEKIPISLSFATQHAGLRIRHVIKNTIHYYMLFNETNISIETTITVPESGPTYHFDPATGKSAIYPIKDSVWFKPHEMKVIIV